MMGQVASGTLSLPQTHTRESSQGSFPWGPLCLVPDHCKHFSLVFVTFLIAETKYATPTVKGGEICLAHGLQRFQAMAGWLQGGVAQLRGIAEEKQLVAGGRQ